MFVCVECGASATNAGPCPHDGHALRDAGDDQILGAQIGPYRVARLLGVGGMGRVYKGVHPQIGSRVAIKVLSRECSDRPDLVERFFSEAKAVNVVAHENIVNVLDLATLPDGRPYIIMEFLDGAPLSAIIEHARAVGPLPLGGIARLAAEVLDALAAAHAKGIIHRDLKPDNIFVSPAGRAKVLDFGIAKLQPQLGGSSTHTGSLLGTPHYMAPEQAAGKVVDARADLYAIGVILFECATLQRPFGAEALFDLLRQHIEVPPPRPRALRTDLPPELEAVILQALAKSPDERFGNANAMSFALQQATAGLPPEAWAPLQPDGTVTSTWTPTPPASWARNKTPPPHTQPTATAPATEHARKRGKGPWLGIGAIVIVGGGIAAATLAGGSKPAQIAVTAGSGSAMPPPTSPPQPPPLTVVTPPAGEPDEVPDEDFNAAADLAGASLEGVPLASLPPGIRAAITKYGSWTTVPVAVKKQLTAELVSFATQAALAPDEPAPPESKKPARPAPLEPHKTADDPTQLPSISSRPPGFDPKRADFSVILPWALGQARRFRGDAQLARVDLAGVYPDGHVELGEIDLRFVSKSHMTKGAHFYEECEFRVDVTPGSLEMRPMSEINCDPELPAPRCTLAQVWKMALVQKPDLGNVPANIIYMSNSANHHVVWDFEVKGMSSLQFADRCGS